LGSIENEKQNKEKTGKLEEETVKVTITKQAEKAMVELLPRINDGFEGGRINRQDLISWILTRFIEDCTEQEIRTIRADHLDEFTLLEMSLKKFKQAGGLPPELRKLLLAQAGMDESPRKSTKKSVDAKVNH
jgi:hypothetical protein